MTEKSPLSLGEGWGEGWHWQKALKTVALTLALSFFIAAPAMAADPVFTLDNIKEQNTAFINSQHAAYALTALGADEDVPEGAVLLNIGDKTYYYTPEENNKNVLQSLASTGSSALIETTSDKALYTVDGKYYTYDTNKLKGSAYSLKEAASADDPNTITLYDKTEVIKYYDPQTGQEVAESDRVEGVEYKEVTTIQTTPKYYTVSLKQTEYGSGDKSMTFGWEKTADGHYELKQNPTNPVGQTIIYKYTETGFSETETHSNKLGTIKNPSGTSSNPTIIEGGAALNNPTGTPDSIDNVLFKDNSTTGKVNSTTGGYKYVDVLGGAVYNEGTLSSVTGAFINNSLVITTEWSSVYSLYVYAKGGAIANKGIIENITADFVGNYVSNSGTIGYSYAKGGAIYNDFGTIGDITGDFIGNYAYSTNNSAYGGAIYNDEGTIGDITGDFIGNYTSPTDYYAYGGAIYNDFGTIGDITGDFIGNYVSSTDDIAYGGAIYNDEGTIGNITGDFIGNYASSTGTGAYSNANGGAIYNNSGTIGNITGDFIGNYVSNSGTGSFADAFGGAIYNYNGATIGNITGDFIGNYASGSSSADGGAIYNYDGATIGNITGDFIGNYASATDFYAVGGAIYNDEGTIGDITGDFIGNYVSYSGTYTTNEYYTEGGAIYNSETIGDITGDFIGNYASPTNSYAYGGAIYNSETIGNITGDFIGNYASGSYNRGGAIYNYYGTIGNITGDFIGNYASGNSSAQGGAIYNYDGATIGDITGDFIGNYASGNSSAQGGAIYNYDGATIGDITGDFIGNYASSTGASTYGGAIYNNSGTIGAKDDEGNLVGGIYGSFINNYAKTELDSRLALGGAVYTSSDMNFIADNQTNYFSGNYTEDYRGKINNAIFVETSSRNKPTIKLQAQNNGVIIFDDQIDGGTSKRNSETNKYEIDRTYAYNLALTGDGSGTISLYNDVINAKVTSDNVTVDLANGETRAYDFVSMTANEGSKLNLDIDFSNKTADTITTQNASTGTLIINAINSLGSADEAITIQIIKNTDPSSTLQLALGDNITEVTEEFVFDKTFVEHNKTFMQEGGISLATTDTTNDSLTIFQEKIFDTLQLINSYETDKERTFQFADSSKYMLSEDLNPTTSGVLNINGISASAPSILDANLHTLFNLQNETTLNIINTSIENAKDFAIKAENINSVINLTNASFKNTDGTAVQSNVDVNITADGGKSEFSGNTTAVKINNASKAVNMNSVNNGEILLEDVIDGTEGYSVKLNGDENSKITINNNVNNANISLDNTNLYLGRENVFDQSQTLSLNSGAIYLNNNAIGTMHVPTLNLNGTTNLSVDVDLANESMDRITADTYNVTKGALLNVTDLNLLSTTEKNSVKILFADEPLANNVEYTGDSPISYKGTNTVYSPIYKYDVQYGVDENDKLGYFFFNRAASGSGSNGNISDAFNPSVLASPVTTQAGAYTTQLQTFNYAFQHADTFMNIPYLERVAIINQGKYALSPTGDATDVGTYSPLMIKQHDPGFWVKPYASFENVPLKNGPKVSNINYGTLVGYDSPLTSVGNGFERVLTGYIGYNGASQRYSGVDAYQNGGLLGGTATFYKGNFFNATTLSVGATAGDASTMYGSENYTMLLAGLGNKTGYNFEFFNGGMILQPSMLISYTFVNTFDYNNAAGVRIESDPMHAIQLAPGIKLIGNTKNGWQPYIGVSMVWNLLDESKVTADSVRLPEMSIKPYVQYGVGLQKRVNDKFLAFGQAMIHNGGRNGVSLSAGLRWKIGRE